MNPAYLMKLPGAALTSLGIVLTAGQSNVHSAQLRSSGHVRD
jgi:hypothetical protein